MFYPLNFLALFFTLSSTFALPHDIRDVEGPHRSCGVHITKERLLAVERKFAASRVPPGDPNVTISIDVHFHIITANETIEGGWVPDDQIKAQVDVLNKDYKKASIKWNHVNTTRVVSKQWFESAAPDTPEESAMKQVFRTGNASVLNVYTVGFVNVSSENNGVLGYATFPSDYAGAPKMDGVVIRYTTMPGGSSPKFNLGRTLTHEIGHWLGLYHTFQGGCTGEGDSVDDTPAEATPNYGCPKKRDTCPGHGADPIHNFMDYSDDACMRDFTPGQITRIRAQTRTFRAVKA